jgi:enoyl-CoA hydratase/carnithine racemase
MREPIRFELHGNVATIALDSPSTGNALDRAMLFALERSIVAALADQSCRVIVLSSTGAEFCVGADLEALEAGQRLERADLELFARTLKAIALSRCPVIACVDGEAAGGGVGLACAADMVIATQRARFILPEVIFGLIPAIVAPVLARRISVGRLRHLALGATAVSAIEAERIGLVDEIAEDGIERALAPRLHRLLRSCPAALEATKRWLQEIESRSFDSLIELSVERAEAWMARADGPDALVHGRKT